VNELTKNELRPRKILTPFVLLLSPFAPQLAEELWQQLGHTTTLAYEPWPAYDEARVRKSTVEIVLQVNGKVRGKIGVAADTPEQELEALGLADENIRRHLDGKKLVKAIVVKNKLVNLVVK
jgi:leucyl-tRNA synthetase